MDAVAFSPVFDGLTPRRPGARRPDLARRLLPPLALAVAGLLLGGCASMGDVAGSGKASQIIISVADQKMTVIRQGGGRQTFPISTSKFGLDGHRRSYTTPTGNLAVAQKVGTGAPVGAVFHSRVRTGEIVKVNSPGRDPIVTRILALRGLDDSNRDALSRGIYIHGTPQEDLIGTPASYGCIRMRSRDVITLYDMVDVGTRVRVIDSTQRLAIAASGVDLNAPRPAGPVPAVVAANLADNNGAPGNAEASAPAPVPPPPPVVAAAPHVNSKPAEVTVVTAPGNTQGWAGSPGKLLADKPTGTVVADPARREVSRPPVPGTTRPVANTAEVETAGGGRSLRRSALDSL